MNDMSFKTRNANGATPLCVFVYVDHTIASFNCMAGFGQPKRAKMVWHVHISIEIAYVPFIFGRQWIGFNQKEMVDGRRRRRRRLYLLSSFILMLDSLLIA